MDPKVDDYIDGVKHWNHELSRLREVVLQSELEEGFKWRTPCYMLDGKNVAMIGGFKAHCVIAFFKGVLLKDPLGLLVQQGPNTESSRSFQFTSLEQIDRHASDILDFIRQAIEVEREGVKIEFTPAEQTPVPEEFERRLAENAALKAAFESLTPGRRKAYFLHVAGAKQSATREARIDQAIPRIMSGKGLHDCVCGLSKRMPACDGSHRSLKRG